MTIKINQFNAPLSDLIPTSNNPRQISKKDFEILKKSMVEFPEVRLSALDNRTSEICAEMDGKTFKMSEVEAGLNVSPLHPNCRSTIAAAFKEFEPETRRYRDPETGKNKYIYNLNYEAWLETIKIRFSWENLTDF